MKKLIIIYIFLNLYFINNIKAQSLIINAKGGLAYVSSINCETGALMNIAIENKINKYLSFGINGKFGGSNYVSDDSFLQNNVIIESRELDISNFVYSLNLYPKLSFINTDELIISCITEFGFYWTESRPVIYFTDEINSKVTHESFNNKHSGRNLGYGLTIEGQYYLNDKLNIIVSLGWNNFDIGKSLNKIDLEEYWEHEINEKTNFLYFEIGIAYRLFGRDIWY
jgi:hypothetical protein